MFLRNVADKVTLHSVPNPAQSAWRNMKIISHNNITQVGDFIDFSMMQQACL
jgi:hypothetical protein